MPQNTPMPPATGARRSPIGIMIAVLAAVAALVLGYVLGSQKAGKIGAAEYQRGRTEATQDASQKFTDAGIIREQTESYDLQGTVRESNGSTIVIEVEQLVRNPLAEQAPTVRTVTLAPEATIQFQTQKDGATFAAEMAAFQSAPPEDELGTRQFPSRFTMTAGTIADIKPGMLIHVTSDADVTYAASITATTVRILPEVPRPVDMDTVSADDVPLDNGEGPAEDTAPFTP